MRHLMKRVTLAALAVLTAVAPVLLSAQERPARFQRREQPTRIPVAVFHSPQAANLPTAETLAKGEWLVEISHRFLPPVSDGADALWGFDGPAFNRLGLAYAASDRVMLGVLRSSLDDNLELNVKARLFEGRSDAVLFMVGAMGGVAWNTAAPSGADDNESQAYAQVMLNALFGRRVAIGVVPTLLRNPRIQDPEPATTFVLGLHGQLYLSAQVSLFGEWIVSEARTELEYDGATFGIELEPGGHFFKILLTNQARTNPTQFLAGTPFRFEAGEWRVGFNITRLLAF